LQILLPHPLPHQARHLASKAPRRLLIAGVGAGKTETLVMEVVLNCFRQPGVDGAVIAPSYTLLTRVLFPTWSRLVPGWFGIPRPSDRLIRTAVGSRIFLVGADRAREKLIAMNLGWVCADEATAIRDPLVLAMAQQRCRVGTDLHVSAFSSPRSTAWAQEWAKGADVVRASTYDNPYLPAQYIANLEAEFPPGTPLHRQEMLGEWVSTTGLVYGELFSRIEHASQAYAYDADREAVLGWDPGSRASAQLLLQRVGPERWGVVRQWLPDNEPTEATAERIQSDLGRPPNRVFLDTPSRLNTRNGLTDAEALRAMWPRCDVHVVGGRARSEDYRYKAVCSALARRRLLISAHLAPAKERSGDRGLIRALEMHAWPDVSTRSERQDQKTPLKHVLDALEFAVANLLPPRYADSSDRAVAV
jgi:hypothetical protein